MNDARLVAEVAELARMSHSEREFQQQFVSMHERFGVEHVVCFNMRWAAPLQVTASVQDDSSILANDMPRYLAEMSPAELDRSLAERVVKAEEVHSAVRREQLALYHEFLGPRRMQRYIKRMWRSASGIHWFVFSFPQATHRRRLEQAAATVMEQLFPIVALTERLYSRSPEALGTADITREATLRFRLTQAEHDTMCLVSRGLTNREIADLGGVALPTIRNRIASCFEKLQVSSRTEAIFTLLESDPVHASVGASRLSEVVHRVG